MSSDPIREIKKLLKIPIKDEYLGLLDLGLEGGRNNFCLVDFRGLFSEQSLNPATGRKDGQDKIFFDPNWVFNFRSLDELTVYQADGSIEWKGKLKKTPKSLIDFYNSPLFLPSDIKLELWMKWFKERRTAKLVRYNKL
jgi:hypothetical protein